MIVRLLLKVDNYVSVNNSSGGVMVNGVGLSFERLQVRFPAIPPSGNNCGQVVHTHVPLSRSSIIWSRPKSQEGTGSMWERCGLPTT